MKIGIIGAGHIGGTLVRRLTALEHEVEVANSRSPDTLAGRERLRLRSRSASALSARGVAARRCPPPPRRPPPR